MKKLLPGSVFILVAVALISASADASTLDNFVVTSTYTSDTVSSPFSTPGEPIAFSFSLPATLPSNLTENNVQMTVSFGGTSINVAGDMEFFPVTNLGLLDIVFGSTNNAYDWNFYGPQLYDSSDNLLLGEFAINSAPPDLSTFFINDITSGTLSGGSVNISSQSTRPPLPEPASFLLLGTGLLGLAAALRFTRA